MNKKRGPCGSTVSSILLSIMIYEIFSNVDRSVEVLLFPDVEVMWKSGIHIEF